VGYYEGQEIGSLRYKLVPTRVSCLLCLLRGVARKIIPRAPAIEDLKSKNALLNRTRPL
jgi:hypothetical protein